MSIGTARFSVADGYVDAGYRDGLSIEATLKIDDAFYFHAESGFEYAAYGLGVGFEHKGYSAILTFNQKIMIEHEYLVDLQLNYYDVKNLSYFAGVNATKSNVGYKIGVGYQVNEKTSLLTHYGDRGLYFGIRKWF